MICGSTYYSDQTIGHHVPSANYSSCNVNIDVNCNREFTKTNYFPYDSSCSQQVSGRETTGMQQLSFISTFTAPSSFNSTMTSYYPMVYTPHFSQTKAPTPLPSDLASLLFPPCENPFNNQLLQPSETSAAADRQNHQVINQTTTGQSTRGTRVPSPDSTSQLNLVPSARKSKGCNCADCQISRTEGAKKTHRCERCGREYGKISHLKAHVRIHLAIRPFVCTDSNCEKKFTRSDELQRHMRIHTGIRNYQCPKCDKKFGRSDHLGKHLKTHERKEASNQKIQNDADSTVDITNPLQNIQEL